MVLQVYTERVSGPGGEAVRLETLVANLLSLVTVPAPGAAPARFSLGAGDRQLVTTQYLSAKQTWKSKCFIIVSQSVV